MVIVPGENYAEVEVEVLRESGAAILVTDGDIEVWVPKSQCLEWPEVGETGTLTAREWIVVEKGLV